MTGRRTGTMPRTSTIRYFKSRHGFYTQYQGRQHPLAQGEDDRPDGPVYLAAVRRFSQLMHATAVEKAADTSPVSAVIARYFHHLKREKREGTLRQARTLLDPAIAELGSLKVQELKPFHVRDWIGKMQESGQWNSTTAHTAIDVLNRALYWAREEGMIASNPVAEMTGKPEKRARGPEVILPGALMDLLIAEASPAFAAFLRMLRGTGARPGEVSAMEARHYRREIGAIVFRWQDETFRWKNAKKTKRDRVIFLTPELQALVSTKACPAPERTDLLVEPGGLLATHEPRQPPRCPP
jgi:integrase